MDEKILEIFRDDKERYIPNEEIRKKLGISQTVLTKYIQRLSKEGYEFEIQPQLGYRLVSIPDLLLPREIKADLETKFIGREIYYFEKVKSTMDIAQSLCLHSLVKEGALIVAESQTEGRGKRKRFWFSPQKEGIWISLILHPKVNLVHIPKMSLIMALAVSKTIRKMVNLPAVIKWPNDVLINKRKVCGALVEKKFNYVIVGLGININVEVKKLPLALQERTTSLKEELGYEISRIKFLQMLLKTLEISYIKFCQQEFGMLIEEIKNLSDTLGNKIKVISEGKEKLRAEAIDLDLEGNLIVRLNDGFLKPLTSGDIEICS